MYIFTCHFDQASPLILSMSSTGIVINYANLGFYIFVNSLHMTIEMNTKYTDIFYTKILFNQNVQINTFHK